MVLELLLDLILLWVMRARRYERIWFDCRAIAESVKTISWKYVMGVAPFKKSVRSSKNDKLFLEELREIRKNRSGAEKHFVDWSTGDGSISGDMRKLRFKSFKERKSIYLQKRLLNQKNWYFDKARFNKTKDSYYYWAVAFFQILALVFSLIQLNVGLISFNATAVFMALAGVLIAWTQIKNYPELGQTYALAGQELASLEGLAASQTKERDFEELVIQVEATISREHTLWCARRNISLKNKAS